MNFPTTLWSQVYDAKDLESPSVHASIAELYQAYREPIFHHFRRLRRTDEEAEELTQNFVADAFQQRVIRSADETRGSFRNYLQR